MRIGRRRQRVTLLQVTPGKNAGGSPTETLTVLAVVAASVEPVSGREAMALGTQVSSELSTVVNIRFRDDLSVRDRIVWNSRTLQIASVQDPDGRRDELQLFCSEVQA